MLLLEENTTVSMILLIQEEYSLIIIYLKMLFLEEVLEQDIERLHHTSYIVHMEILT